MNQHRALITVSVALLMALALIGPASPQAALASSPQIALGGSVAVADSQSLAAFDDYTAKVGRAPALWTLWSRWGGGDGPFPSDFVNSLLAHSPGTVPMIYWEPVGTDQSDCAHWALSNIIRGDYDEYIRTWATAARDYGGRVIVRFAEEMNGYWYIWGNNRCTNTPAKFRRAWRHVWNIFRGPNGVGANNVAFLWSVYGRHRVLENYPGSAYVDYTGLTAFNWAQRGHPSWRTMVRTFNPAMYYLLPLGKPIIVAEMGAGYNPNCAWCDKPAYITQGYPAVYAKWSSKIAALVYFNLDMRDVGQPDFRLDSPPQALTAYQQIVADPRFQGTIP